MHWADINLKREARSKGSVYMFKYALQRILYMCLVLLIITGMCFVLVRMLPPVELPPGDPHTAVIEARREAQGYNEPYMVQFGIFLKNIFTKFDWVYPISCTSVRMFGRSLSISFLHP